MPSPLSSIDNPSKCIPLAKRLLPSNIGVDLYKT